MALQKQPMELLFGQGIDTKSDPKTLEIGNLSILENGVLKKKNRIDKRHGYNHYRWRCFSECRQQRDF